MERTNTFAGLSASAARKLVAPGQHPKNTKALPTGRVYVILRQSLDNRPDRDWWPAGDPEYFVVLPSESVWKKDDLAWWPVWDGKPWSWSYQKGFSGARTSDLMTAARAEVENQIAPLRKRGFEVHHAKTTFKALFSAFLECFGLSESEIVLKTGEKPGEIAFQNPLIALFWAYFHSLHATLEVIPVDEHRRIHGRSRNE